MNGFYTIIDAVWEDIMDYLILSSTKGLNSSQRIIVVAQYEYL